MENTENMENMENMENISKTEAGSKNFIEKLVQEDIDRKAIDKIITRFPPEPNGYLHIGSAYAINISYRIAQQYNGQFNLRFDDTNPLKEDAEYVQSIIDDIHWLGCDYYDQPFYGSDYSAQIFQYAIELITKGKAFVCDLSFDQMREYRGTLTALGKNSPYRERSVEENLDLFYRMNQGEFEDGSHVLRAKIDMESPNLLLRDPVIYRIIKTEHYRQKDRWCIYPMYDFAHPLQDYIEGVTHSLCSNEFINHRPLYEWVLNNLDLTGVLPRQIEFGRLNLTGVVTSKRYLRQLVDSGILEGWDDPRLPTLKGIRRRGIRRQAIFDFLNEIGVPKSPTTIDYKMLEYFVRQDLEPNVNAIMAVKNPLKVEITNYKEELEYVTGENHPKEERFGQRSIPFGREIYIEAEDFSLDPPKKYKRLSLGQEVRLRHAYFIKCEQVVYNPDGSIQKLLCTYDLETKSGTGFDKRKPKGTIHWVSATESVKCTIREFDDLFLTEFTEEDLLEKVNPESKVTYPNAYVEKGIQGFIDRGEERFQFIRHGFFYIDDKLSQADELVFNRIVGQKISYKK